MNGDTVAVGADGGFSGGIGTGSAYVFVKPAGGWAGAITQDAKLSASDGAEGDVFSSSLAVSGGTVVVGADRDDIGANSDQGSGYVFVKPVGGWAGTLTENAKLTASDGTVNGSFGGSVAIDGDTVASAGSRTTSDRFFPSGYVFVKPAGAGRGRSRRTPAHRLARGGFVLRRCERRHGGDGRGGPRR